MLNRSDSTGARLALLACGVLIVGCGESGPSPVKVSGVVTLNGKPVEGAVVSFLPDPSSPNGRPAEDLTGPEGNYRAQTNGRTGVIPGKYHVVVSRAPVIPEAVAKNEAFKEDPYMAQLSAGLADGRGKKASGAIEASFDRDIPPEGGVFDFDVKLKAADVK